jgi:hypothetical protein
LADETLEPFQDDAAELDPSLHCFPAGRIAK